MSVICLFYGFIMSSYGFSGAKVHLFSLICKTEKVKIA